MRDASAPFPTDVRWTHTDSEYERLATMHRPSCKRCLERVARDLRNQGLKAADIGDALGMSATAVEQLLGEREAQP